MAANPDSPWTDRELSWLAFNERVLQEAADPDVPLGERLGFLAIFSSNLDEFFRVRVASLRSLLRLKKKRIQRLGLSPAELLGDIHAVVTAQQTRFGRIFRDQVLPALAEHGIRLVTERELTPEQAEVATSWFDDRVAPNVEAALLEDRGPPPFLRDRGIYLVVELWPVEGRGVGATAPRYGLVRVPSPPLPRFLALGAGAGRHVVIFLDDVIRACLGRVFPAFEPGNAYAIKLSRDAELHLEDEYAGDIVESIRKSLGKRETGMPCRFLYDLQAPVSLTSVLDRLFDLEEEDFVPGGRYHNLHDLRDFPLPGGPGLRYLPLDPLPDPDLESSSSLIGAAARRDHLLHFPYQRFDYVIRLLEEAGEDPDVEEIWITLYRVARDSAIAEALIRAAHAGKRVTAFVEVKARFDEESNLAWAGRMEEAGVQTVYSLPGLKVHAKLALIVRREEGERRSYAYLGTGNFNERTARVYTDHGLITADPRLTAETRRVFAFISGEDAEPQFEHLLVAPFTLRKRLNRMIDREAEAAIEGRPAGITLKLNSLEDRKIIDRLYRASRAGVDIRLIVRGICCLVPGVAGASETIRARSIVDRFLEHTRIFIFENGGDRQFFLSSADWMSRNLSRRVEVAFPILDERLQRDIETFIRFQIEDNRKARIVDEQMSNHYAREPAAPPLRAQVETYRFLARGPTVRPHAASAGLPIDGANP